MLHLHSKPLSVTKTHNQLQLQSSILPRYGNEEGSLLPMSEARANSLSENASRRHVSAPVNKVHRGATLSGRILSDRI